MKSSSAGLSDILARGYTARIIRTCKPIPFKRDEAN
jgi:hypothetical protein